jgi:hypothetical protein
MIHWMCVGMILLTSVIVGGASESHWERCGKMEPVINIRLDLTRLTTWIE